MTGYSFINLILASSIAIHCLTINISLNLPSRNLFSHDFNSSSLSDRHCLDKMPILISTILSSVISPAVSSLHMVLKKVTDREENIFPKKQFQYRHHVKPLFPLCAILSDRNGKFLYLRRITPVWANSSEVFVSLASLFF